MSAKAKKSQKMTGVIGWIDERLPIFTMLGKEYGRYPMPRNCNYLWSFGGMSMFMLVVMVLTGILLAMHYTPHIDMAFDSVERINRDVNSGWLMRSIHMNGASMFFIVVYIHMLRGLYYGSYKQPRELLWIFGVVILILMMATAFLGYSLVWGQMSYWAVTVISGLLTAIPLVGEDLMVWLRGGFAVDNATLNRFFVLHYLLPFVIIGMVVLHVAALHITGSNNPAGIDPKGPQDTLPFHPYMTAKDILALSVFLVFYAVFVFFYPDALGHPDNYIPANPLQTPAHIVPEWYFLPFYAMLRAMTFDIFFISAKLIGVIVMFGALVLLVLAPWLDTSPVRSCRYRPFYRQFFWLLVVALVVLTYVGGKPAEGLYVLVAQLATLYYYLHFLVVMPVLGRLERPRPLPVSIREPVLGEAS
ncbi:MAG: cytochrome b N-terminal domain-containing protein [Pseudomonadota bacterium]